MVGERCTPVNVAVFDGSRMHVQCAVADSNVAYFAYPITSTNGEQVRRMLDVALTAMNTKGTYLVIYADYYDMRGQKFGFASADCRKINGISASLDP